MKRYQVYDELGLARTFDSKEDAHVWMKERPELKLVILPRQKKEKVDLYKLVGECLF